MTINPEFAGLVMHGDPTLPQRHPSHRKAWEEAVSTGARRLLLVEPAITVVGDEGKLEIVPRSLAL